MENNKLEILVSQAIEGDKKALNALVDGIQKYIYNISLKILWRPDEAKDATQEILIKIVTHLSSFKSESNFTTWTYRIANNYLLNYLGKLKRKQNNFKKFAIDLSGETNETYEVNNAERKLLEEEVKIGCSMGMLQCLDTKSRITYILGDILEFNSNEGAYIQGISAEAFRKRLSRTRNKINRFTKQHCGIVNPANKCRCHKKIDCAISKGKINGKHLLFAAEGLVSSITKVESAAGLIQSNPEYELPERRLNEIKKMMELEFN